MKSKYNFILCHFDFTLFSYFAPCKLNDISYLKIEWKIIVKRSRYYILVTWHVRSPVIFSKRKSQSFGNGYQKNKQQWVAVEKSKFTLSSRYLEKFLKISWVKVLDFTYMFYIFQSCCAFCVHTRLLGKSWFPFRMEQAIKSTWHVNVCKSKK